METLPWSAPKTEFAAVLKDLISVAAKHPSWWEDAPFAAAMTTLTGGKICSHVSSSSNEHSTSKQGSRTQQ
jgi:hypothetical protein